MMIIVEESMNASFGGNLTDPCAYLEVKNVGELSSEITSELSRRLGELVQKEFGIPLDRIYIEFQESKKTPLGMVRQDICLAIQGFPDWFHKITKL